MKRFTNKEIERILQHFEKKISLQCFSKHYFVLKKTSGDISWDDKKAGGNIEAAYLEISVLYQLGDYYKALYLHWTGNQRNGEGYDGILYFNEHNEQKVEISRILDEEEMKDFRRLGFSEREYEIDVHFDLNKGIGQETLNDGAVIPRNFIYKRIVKILNKKNKQKYKGCWLVIPYDPYSLLGEFNKYYIRSDVLKKMKDEKKDLLHSINSIFKKIIFLPHKQNSYIFEWKP